MTVREKKGLIWVIISLFLMLNAQLRDTGINYWISTIAALFLFMLGSYFFGVFEDEAEE